MILVAVVLFGLAVALGLYLVILGVRRRRGSRALAAVHAGVALLGLGVLGKVIFDGPKHLLYNDAALLFVVALCGGLVLLAVRIGESDRRSPTVDDRRQPPRGHGPHCAAFAGTGIRTLLIALVPNGFKDFRAVILRRTGTQEAGQASFQSVA